MSTLEHPDGESDVSQPPTKPEIEPDQSDDADGATSPDPGEPADPDVAEPDPTEGSTLEHSSPIDPFEADEIAVAPTAVRRAPRYGRFATIGGLLGLALAFMLTPLADYDEPGMVLDPWGLGLLLAAILTPIGILLGCILALVADRRSRRARR